MPIAASRWRGARRGVNTRARCCADRQFSSFASSRTAGPAPVDVPELVADVVDPYAPGWLDESRSAPRAGSIAARLSTHAHRAQPGHIVVRCGDAGEGRLPSGVGADHYVCFGFTKWLAWTTHWLACSSRTSPPRRQGPDWACRLRDATSNCRSIQIDAAGSRHDGQRAPPVAVS